MAEQIQSLDADTHILLDQPLLRVPHELLRKNLKSAQRHVDQAGKNMTKDLQAQPSNSAAALASLDALLAKATNLQRKLEQLAAEEKSLHAQQSARIAHLTRLHDISSLSDVAYDNWSHTRLDRLLVDHLLRQGHSRSARLLADEQDILPLVDLAVFEDSRRIEQSLLAGKTAECLAWCGENKQALKKINSNLELELRLQQFIELARGGDVGEKVAAIVHARKHLAGGQEVEFGLRAGGLLAHECDTMVEPYRMMYAPARYPHLANLFLKTHHSLLQLPSQPLLYTALSAGLSALKTPSCHSVHTATHTGAPVCPICSTELNALAKGVPYAHHTKSFIDEDPVVLPNGRVYGRAKLEALNTKLGIGKGRVRDPAGGEEWAEEEVRRVFIL
ncbi:related to Protein FYV10 [Ramularia collo-cygni]|uniref:Related to Protein FYV10 n=1 Tax=Ramularia collo-cygni TaxID=112498 RepID=A0A2D3V6R7_9PEZI|nr:related to Protein FYV10 [Ramularia collo-cygni]CZT17179.1 related to Protein FYV10 [Ramularia collo-cygni]